LGKIPVYKHLTPSGVMTKTTDHGPVTTDY
jgi:hypothetical protein